MNESIISRGPLCDYSSSSDEESEEGRQEIEHSPRKRKCDKESILNQSSGSSTAFFPRDAKGGIDLLGSEEAWKRSLGTKLRSFIPRSQPGEKSHFEFDSTNLELRVIHKHRRRLSTTQEEGEEEKDTSFECERPSTAPRRRKFAFKPFKKTEQGKLLHDESRPEVTVLVTERLEASYGLYVWPSSHILSWYIWVNEADFRDKRILELGSGTSLPGLLCAKIGAKSLVLTDKGSSPEVLSNIRTAIEINDLEGVAQIKELTWGHLSQNLIEFEGSVDIILGSDLFFDPKVFRDLVLTVGKLLSINPTSVFICAVQERSPDWSIEEYLVEFNLGATYVYPEEFLAQTGIHEGELIGGQTIYIMKLFLK